MAVSLQVLYPTENGTTFDHDYYIPNHMEIVVQHIGHLIEKTLVTKGLAGGPDTPAGYHAIATMVFADQAALEEALGASEPILQDIPKFFSGQPQILIGEVTG